MQRNFLQLDVQLLEYVHLSRLFDVFCQAFLNFAVGRNFRLHSHPNILQKEQYYSPHWSTKNKIYDVEFTKTHHLFQSWHITITTSAQVKLTFEENLTSLVECKSLKICYCLWRWFVVFWIIGLPWTQDFFDSYLSIEDRLNHSSIHLWKFHKTIWNISRVDFSL